MEKMMLFQSKSSSNLFQITVFFAINVLAFKVLLNYFSKKYGHLKAPIPVEKYTAAGIRVLSIFHATVVTLLSMLILYTDNDLNQNKLLYSAFAISFTLNFSMGFLVFDFIMMLIDKQEFDLAFLLHHFVSVAAFFSCSTAGVFPYIALFRLTSEASTPFLNIRWLLLTMQKKSSKLYLFNGIILVIVFFIVRITTIIPNWLIFFSLWNTPEWYAIELKYKFICVVSCVPLDIMNVYWFSKIIKILVKFFKFDLRKMNYSETDNNSSQEHQHQQQLIHKSQ